MVERGQKGSVHGSIRVCDADLVWFKIKNFFFYRNARCPMSFLYSLPSKLMCSTPS